MTSGMKRAVLTLAMGFAVAASPLMAVAEPTAKTTLTIKGMTCGGCVAAVKLQLKRTEGVTAYDVSLEKGEAEVSYEPARTDPNKIAQSVSETGFATSPKATHESGKDTPDGRTTEPAVKDGSLDPWEPMDAAFMGCSEGVCGRRGRSAEAVAQPGAQPGQSVYCPVSGAVFRIKESSPRAEVGGKTVYVCCEACARYFSQNRDRVLALRGLSQ